MDEKFFLDNLWRRSAGVRERTLIGVRSMPSLEQLRNTERDQTFERLRTNRKVIGAFRYGRFRAVGKPVWDRISSIISRAERYRNDGNLEHLVDIANLAELEFSEGKHPKRHWGPTDDGQHVMEVS